MPGTASISYPPQTASYSIPIPIYTPPAPSSSVRPSAILAEQNRSGRTSAPASVFDRYREVDRQKVEPNRETGTYMGTHRQPGQYLIDSYVENHLGKTLEQAMRAHDASSDDIILGIYDLQTQRITPTGLFNLSLTVNAELQDGSVIPDQAYIFPIDAHTGNRILTSRFSGEPFYTDRMVNLTQQAINNHKYIIISPYPDDRDGLTPNWGIWNNYACYLENPCNMTFELVTNTSETATQTYNLSTAGIALDKSSFVALPEFTLQSGETVRIIFYLEPTEKRRNTLRKIIIQLYPIKRERFRDRIRDRLRGH